MIENAVWDAIEEINRTRQRAATYNDIYEIIISKFGNRWGVNTISRMVRHLAETNRIFRFNRPEIQKRATWIATGVTSEGL